MTTVVQEQYSNNRVARKQYTNNLLEEVKVYDKEIADEHYLFTIRYSYNAQRQLILKESTVHGKIEYVRNENGKILSEYTYFIGDVQPKIKHYLYDADNNEVGSISSTGKLIIRKKVKDHTIFWKFSNVNVDKLFQVSK